MMVVGSGLIAKAFSAYSNDASMCIYAAGVSNSSCRDPLEYERDRKRLLSHLRSNVGQVVYFGTCSVADPDAVDSMYVRHKLAMEALVRESNPQHLIVRLPQVAGNTPNPHTLLNYLHARVSRSERFDVWLRARRNVIDVSDVAKICHTLISHGAVIGETINVANTLSYHMLEIVHAMERVLGKPAIYDVKPRGSHYEINCTRIINVAADLGIVFDERYLDSVLGKYYG